MKTLSAAKKTIQGGRKMKNSFKRAFSLALALLMLTLAVPFSFSAVADTDTSSTLLKRYEGKIVTEDTADYVYVIDGTDDKANGHYKSLEDAIEAARKIYDSNKTGTHYMKVLTSLTPAATYSSGTNINFTINFSLTIDGSAAATKPVITVGSSAQASYWMCAGNSTSPVVTVKDVDLDFKNLKMANGTDAANAFDIRGGTLILDNCVIANPTAGTMFNNLADTTRGNLVCVDTKIVSDLSTLAPATKDCVNFSSVTATNHVNVYLENCTFVTSSTYSVYVGKNSDVEIYGGTYETNKEGGYAARFSEDSTVKIYGGKFKSHNNAILTGARCAVTIDDGTFENTKTDAAATSFGANSSVVINGGSFTSPKTALNVGTGGLVNIYDGYFETTGDNSITLDACDNNSMTSKPDDLGTNVYAPAGACAINFYGGYFVNSANDDNQCFVIRPRNGAVNNVYGGTFVSTRGAAVIGAGESGTTGYLNIYDGTFIKSGTTGENLMTNYFNNAADKWGAKYYYLYGGTYYTAKANDNTAYRLSSHADTTYNRAYDEVEYSAKLSAPKTETLAGRDGKTGTADDITAAWVDICKITPAYAIEEKPMAPITGSHNFDAIADAITEKNADYVYVVDGVGSTSGAYKTLADAMVAARNVYNGGNATATHYIKLLTDVTETAAFDTVHFNLTIDGTQAAEKPVITVGNGDSTASSWLIVGTNTAPTVTIKGVDMDFTAASKADGTKANGFSVRGGTLVLEDCVIAEPTDSSVYVFQNIDHDGTIACLDVKIASSLEEGAVSKKSIINFGSSQKDRNIYLDGCDFTSSVTPIINLGTNSNVDLYIYGGTYKTTAAAGRAILVNKNSHAYIYGGEFEAAGITIANSQEDPNGTKKPEGTPDNAHVAEGASHVYIYGGSFKVTGNTADNFVFRPWKGAAVTVYGGTFEAPNGSAVFGAGESGTRGYVYIYGGTFIKSAATGTTLLHNNYNDSNDWKDKYYYIYGGTFYTAKADDIRAYRAGNDANDRYNRAYGEVVYTDIDRIYNGKTYADAVTVSAKTPTGVRYAEDLFANAYQQVTRGTTANSEKTNLRLVVEVKNSELENVKSLGFWLSGDNPNVMDRAELDNSIEKITDKGNIHFIYNSVVENAGAKANVTYAREGYSFVVVEIKDIQKVDFGDDIYFRIYAEETNEATGATVIHVSDVKTAGVYKSIG